MELSTMKTEKENTVTQPPSAQAMAFHHASGLTASWLQAMNFAGKEGRLASLSDILSARISNASDTCPWQSALFTTTTAEYFGKSKQGTYILIVAHGVGPMSTLTGVQETYGWKYKGPNRRGGRITEQQFRNLEEGVYGPVAIVDYEAYCASTEWPFFTQLHASEVLNNPILRARLGPNIDEYVRVHSELARRWHREEAGLKPDAVYTLDAKNLTKNFREVWDGVGDQAIQAHHWAMGAQNSDPYIFGLHPAANCYYGDSREPGYMKIKEGYAVAHLVDVGRVGTITHYPVKRAVRSLVSLVALHEWNDTANFVALKPGSDITQGIWKGPNPERLLYKYWSELFMPASDQEEVGLRALMDIHGVLFTKYPEKGKAMDNCEPEYRVLESNKIGFPVEFRTEIAGHHDIFSYSLDEVRAIAPPRANAFLIVDKFKIVSERDGFPSHHTCHIQFYRVTLDKTQRLMRVGTLRFDYDRLLALTEKERDSEVP
jgi:hypothetical protein